jgi:light-regulated signal transduction histidine kinase (bacteriophytochrome)
LADERSDLPKTLAALGESRRDLESLTYTIAHDLRAPLRTIDGFARALQEDCGDCLDEHGRRYLKHVLDAAHRMSQMCEGLLSLARIQGAQLTVLPLELSPIASRILERLHAAEPARTLEAVIPDGIAAHADRSLLALALEALIENAWKFTRCRERARIELGTQPTTPLVYFVSDNGVGFDMRHAEKLFRPFQRLHSQGEYEGVGIGLAAAERIIRRHGGRLWAQSAPNGGASFYFTLAQ